ncbi:MAG: hypothetical protein K0S39_1806 [Paenibacillus sp.]|jgi:hypothetical protein|nr:hypothetical protein [Paenibacillus sp.]
MWETGLLAACYTLRLRLNSNELLVLQIKTKPLLRKHLAAGPTRPLMTRLPWQGRTLPMTQKAVMIRLPETLRNRIVTRSVCT